MRKFLLMIFAMFAVAGNAYADDVLAIDTNDPLYMTGAEQILSETNLTYWDHILRVGETLSYGLNSRLVVGANVHYQEDFNGHEDGFSAVDFGGIYRIATPAENNMHIISDVLLGLKVGGSSKVRTPYYADSTYYAGLRFGRQWTGLTLAATVKSSWIFDGDRGMAYIDFMPEAYFRINPDWRAGANFTWRKATNPDYDQEWIGGKIVRQFGRTQYTGHIDYEFESEEVQVGAKVNVLF